MAERRFTIKYESTFVNMPLPGVQEFAQRQKVDGGWSDLDIEALLRGVPQVRVSKDDATGIQVRSVLMVTTS